MRLVCPNCDSEYEVDRAMIPADGRDVQCSNCMHTWFQPGETDTPFDTEPEPVPPVTEPEVAYQSSATSTEHQADAAPTAGRATDMRVKSPTLSDEARTVLEEEVARESEARKADQAALETQMDMDLDAAPTLDPTQNRVSRIRQEVADKVRSKPKPAIEPPSQEATAEQTAKKDLLPDVEEINSTWDDPTTAPVYDDEDVPLPPYPGRGRGRRRTAGFRVGFGAVLAIAATIIILYVIAPMVSERIPALSPIFSDYVWLVDSWRTWLEQIAQSWIASGSETQS